MVQPLTATFVADFSNFKDAVGNAETALKDLGLGAGNVEKSLISMGNSLAGNKIVTQATIAGEAVELLGGTATLTDKELQKIGRTADEAGEKFKKLGLEVPPKIQAISDAAKDARTSTGLLGSIADEIGPKFLAAFSVGAIAAWASSTIDAASHIEDLSRKLDVSHESIQRWGYAASLSGGSIDDVATSLAFMNKTLAGGSDSTIDALSQAGIQFQNIRNESPEDAFNDIVAAIQKIPDPMTQARVATELLGKGAAVLLPAIRDGFKEVGAEATIMSEKVIAANDKLGDSWATLKGKAAVFSATLLTLIAEGIQQYNGETRESIKDTEEQVTKSFNNLTDGALKRFTAGLGAMPDKAKPASQALNEFNKVFDPIEQKRKDEATKAVEDHTAKIKGLADTLTGQAVAQKAKDLGEALKLAGGSAHLSADQTEEFFKAADALVKGPMGSAALPKNLKDFWETNGHLALTLENEVNPALDKFYDHLFGIDQKLPELKNGIKTILADTKTTVVEFWHDDDKAGTDASKHIRKQHEEDLKAIEERHNQFVQTVTGYTAGLVDGLVHGWDSFKSAAQSVGDDILRYFEKVFVTKMLEHFGVVESHGLSMFTNIGKQSTTTMEQVVADQQTLASAAGTATSAASVSYATMFGSMISGMATVYLAWKFLQAALAPHITPRTPTPTSPPPNTSPNPEPGSPDYGSSLDYAEQLAQQAAAAGNGQEARQALEDYLYSHPELRGHSPSGSFRAGTQGQYLDFGAGTPVMLHGKERVMTENEGDRSGWGGTIVVQTLDSADFESFLRRGGARQIADALGPHLVRVLA